MTDKELLELAAKAAGVEIEWESDGTIQNRMNRPTIPYFCQNLSSAIDWNPLTDDGDALRLAVKLNMGISIPIHQTIKADVICFGDSSVSVREEGNDPYAATRRAIVRAAAEIGRSM